MRSPMSVLRELIDNASYAVHYHPVLSLIVAIMTVLFVYQWQR